MRVFERLVGLGSLESLEAFLIHWQVAFPNFSGCRVDFFQGHCFNYLFGEFSFSYPFHNFHVFLGFLPILVGGDRCKRFKAIPFLGSFEINVRVFFP